MGGGASWSISVKDPIYPSCIAASAPVCVCVCVFSLSFFLFISVHSYSISQRKRDESELYLVKLLASVSVFISQYVCMYVGSVCGNSHRRM